MGVAKRLRRFAEDDIVQWGIDVPVVGMVRGESQELRDMALALGASLHLPRPPKPAPPAPEAPAEPPAEPALPRPVAERRPRDRGVPVS